MKKNLMLVLMFLGISLFSAQTMSATDRDNNKGTKAGVASAPAQTWEFYSVQQTPSAEELAAADNHKLGKEVGCLYTAFMEMYVVKEEVVPGDPAQRTVIRKPAIYNAVRSIEKLILKSTKDNTLTKEEAAENLMNVLTVALAAIDSESDSFEEALQSNKKDNTRLLAIFENVTLKKIG